MNATNFEIYSHIGFEFRNPLMGLFPTLVEPPPPTWAKTRYNELRWKLCCRTAVWRGILATLIALVSFAAINTGLFFLAVWIHTDLFFLEVGILNFLMLKLIFLIVGDYYDGNNVQPKRRGRKLNYAY